MSNQNNGITIFFKRIKDPGFCCLLVLLFLPCAAHSQTLDFKNYSTKDGLITDEVYNLHQDKQGYIWLFTRLGPLKYNGTEFKPVLKNLPFKENFIYCIYENKKGQKWVANSNAKIYEIRNDSAFTIKGIEKISESLKNSVSEIYQLYVDDSLNITAITKALCYTFVKKGNSYTAVKLNKSGIQTDVNDIWVYEAGNDVYGVYNYYKNFGIFYEPGKYNLKIGRNGKIVSIPAKLSRPVNLRRFKKFNTTIYFFYDSFLGKIQNNDSLKYTNFNSRILNYTRDKNNHTWVGCLNDGLYELDEHDSIINHYFENITVNDVLADSQSGIWISTPESGLYYCANPENKYSKKDGPLSGSVSFIKKIGDDLFIANKKGDLFLAQNDSLLHLRKADDKPLRTIIKNGKDFLLLQTYLIENLSLTGSAKLSLTTNNARNRSNIFLKNKDTLLSVWPLGITFSVKGKETEVIRFNQKILSSECINGVLWLGTENGAYCYPPLIKKTNRHKDSASVTEHNLIMQDNLVPMRDAEVIKIVKGDFNDIWFCTRGDGLFKLENKKLTHYTVHNGLPSDIINNISFTEDHSALLSTNKGLFISAPDLHTKTEGNEQDAGYGNWDEIFNGEVKTAVYFKNKIYLNCRNGLVIINSKRHKKSGNQLFFNLAAIWVDVQEVNAENFKGIHYAQKNITFNFDIINFTNLIPDVSYILHGPVNDTGFATNATVKFNSLPPGNYELTAFPAVKDGYKLKITLPFTVEPAFWQTGVFQLSVVVVALAAILLIMIVVLRYTKKRIAIKTKNEQLIEEYKLIALKAQINPHFISNCLSAVQNLIMSSKTERAIFYIARFGLIVRQILDYSSKTVISLSDELELLGLYVQLEQLRFENKFNFLITVDDGSSLNEIFIPPLLLTPIVENAIWHGLLPLPSDENKELTLEVKRSDNRLIIIITDNGVGRRKKEQKAGKWKADEYGIKITEQRLLNINYLYPGAKARMVYEDLKDANKKPCGTRVYIYLPLDLKPLKNISNF